MSKPKLVFLGCLGLWSACTAAQADGALSDSLTAARVVELAGTRAPEVLIAQTRVLEARGRLAGARALVQENPAIEGVANSDRRFERRSELEFTLPIELGIRRSKRIAVARAEMQREDHLVGNTRRQAIGVALAAYYRVLHAEQRIVAARERKALAEELLRVAVEKHRTGDAARLDVNVAETELSRAESEILSEERALAGARADLAIVLGLQWSATLAVAGELSDRSYLDRLPGGAEPGQRPDVLAAQSEVRAAAAGLALGWAALIPDVALRWNHGHEDGQSVERRGLGVTVPLFNLGQGERGEARARRERARVELESRQVAAAVEAEAARTAYSAAVAAARQLEEHGVPRALETEAMARESYRAGKMDLPAVLVVRREALDTRREHLDRLLEAALSGIDLAVATGAFH
jgi:cobalt-zinc-cadmium efflux system outer membrane protein